MSNDGTTIAIGAPYNDNDDDINAGHVRVYGLPGSITVHVDADTDTAFTYTGDAPGNHHQQRCHHGPGPRRHLHRHPDHPHRLDPHRHHLRRHRLHRHHHRRHRDLRRRPGEHVTCTYTNTSTPTPEPEPEPEPEPTSGAVRPDVVQAPAATPTLPQPTFVG